MRQLTHVVFIAADNTDVFGGTIIEEVPEWARHLIVITGFSDYDALVDLTIQRDEFMRQSAPHVFAADNLLDLRLTNPHIISPVDRIREFPINCNFNVVTAGTGLVVAMYSG